MEFINQANNRELTELVSAAMDLGEQLLICGGEVSRVEDTIRRLCIAYGAENVDVFTITSCVIVTADFGEKGSISPGSRSTPESRFVSSIAYPEFQRKAIHLINSGELAA